MEYSAPEKSPCAEKVRIVTLLIAGLRDLVKYKGSIKYATPKEIPKSQNRAIKNQPKEISKSHNHKSLKKIVMNTQITNTRIVKEISTVINQTRSKIISAADVWNIQRQKRVRVQRRFAL